MARNKLSIFLFHRDLRLHDNTGLIAACDQSERVLPCFIFTPTQLQENPYRGNASVQFMLECLEDLEGQLAERGAKLHLYFGEPEQIITEIVTANQCDALFANRDYTPFARQRDRALAALCNRLGVSFSMFGDALLHEPEEVTKADGTPYSVFTPYWKAAKKIAVRQPVRNTHTNFITTASPAPLTTTEAILAKRRTTAAVQGGRTAAKKMLQNLAPFRHYKEERDFPALGRTTKLSAFNKFGCCSIREVYFAVERALGADHDILRELYWRDFFTAIGFHFPHVFSGAFIRKLDAVPWENNEDYFTAWCEGRTGFPIVDAGMRELATTGFMHNRVRMIVASFLTKDLHIDWRWGERHFAQQLVDYDPSVNNGSWQWAASTGCDAQPYFRVFNPWLQQKKFDAQCIYIKQWIPELRTVPPAQIHALEEGQSAIGGYPTPLVEHAVAKEWVEDTFRGILKG